MLGQLSKSSVFQYFTEVIILDSLSSQRSLFHCNRGSHQKTWKLVLQGVLVLASHKQMFWFKAGDCAVWRHQSNSMLTEYSRDKGPFLAGFDQLPLKQSAVTSLTEDNYVSGTVPEIIISNS